MYIAELNVSLLDAGIQYNRAEELGTDKARGALLPDGQGVVRGLGTHFKTLADKERFDRLTKESNVVREAFNRRFVKAPLKGVVIIAEAGEALAFVQTLKYSTGIEVSVTEMEISGLGAGFSDKKMREWSERVKTQLERIPLGRGKKENVSKDGISALIELAKCPVLSKATSEAINMLANQAKAGSLDRVELSRSIELLSVELDQSSLAPRRPTADIQ